MLLNFLCWRPSLQSARRIASKRILVLTEFLLNFVLTGLYTLMSRSCLLGYLVYHYRERSWVSLSYVFSYMIKFRVMFLAAVRVTAWSLFIVYCVSVIFTRSEIHRMIAWVNSCVLTGYPHWHRFFWPCLGRFEQTAQRVADVLGYKAVNMFSRDVNKNCLIKGCCWSTIAHTGFFPDIKSRDNSRTPACDWYGAGFPCQPFSTAGLGMEVKDHKERGILVANSMDYIQKHRPGFGSAWECFPAYWLQSICR